MKEKLTVLFSKKLFLTLFISHALVQLFSMLYISLNGDIIRFGMGLSASSVCYAIIFLMLYISALEMKVNENALKFYRVLKNILGIMFIIGGVGLLLGGLISGVLGTALSSGDYTAEFEDLMVNGEQILPLYFELLESYAPWFLVSGIAMLGSGIFALTAIRKMKNEYYDYCAMYPVSGKGITAMIASIVLTALSSLSLYISNLLSEDILLQIAELAIDDGDLINDISISSIISTVISILVIPVLGIIGLLMYKKVITSAHGEEFTADAAAIPAAAEPAPAYTEEKSGSNAEAQAREEAETAGEQADDIAEAGKDE